MPLSAGNSVDKESRRPSTFWVSPTSVGPTTKRATSRYGGRRWVNVWQPSSRKLEHNCNGVCTPAFPKPASGCGRWCGGISSITRFRGTGDNCERFAPRFCTIGAGACGGGANAAASRGSKCATVSRPCCHPSKFCNPTPTCASTPNITPSEVRTVCANSASTGLCGGQRVTAVPTATDFVRLEVASISRESWGQEQKRESPG